MAYIHVAERSNALVMNPANPEVLTAVIPTAKPVQVGPHLLYAVPHTLDAVAVLRNLGVAAPSPILNRYSWPGRFTPMHAQRETAAFLTLNRRAFVLNDMGTGKTASALWAFDYLRSLGLRRKVLVAAPLSTLESTWAAEVMLGFPHLRYAVLHGDRDRRRKLLAQDKDVYIVNHHGLKVLKKELEARKDIDLLILDELSIFRTPGTDLFKAAAALTAMPDRWVWGMTGTPTPNEPTDAWAQVRLIRPANVPPYFKRFKEQTMVQVREFKWKPREGSTEIVRQAMQPAIRFAREECTDLPPTTWQYRDVVMTPEQTKAYKEMQAKLRMEFEGGQAKAVNQADKAMKLVQIASGAVYDAASHEPIILPTGPRMEVVKEVIEQSSGNVIVFVPYVAALHAVRDELAKTWPTDLVYGEVSYNERTEIFANFQNSTGKRVLVANARVMSHGLTLTNADTIIWFASPASHETFDQANHRIIRISQKRNTLIVMIRGCQAERALYKRLTERQEMQDGLLDAVVMDRTNEFAA